MTKKTPIDQGLKFLSVDINNFKNIQKKQIEIGGRSLIVLGSNGAGKSSFISALLSPLNTKFRPSVPIRQGEERSEIEVVIGGNLNNEAKKYILNLYFTPGNASGRLTLHDETGADVKNPASIVKQIVGEISFSIFDFLNSKKQDKIDTLKKLTGKAKEIDIAANEIKALKENRKSLKDRIENAESSMKNHGFSADDIEKYSEPIKLEPIQTELATISVSIDNWSKVENGVNERQRSVNTCKSLIHKGYEDIQTLENMIVEIQEKIKFQNELILSEDNKIVTLKEEIVKGEDWLSKNIKPSAEVISKKLTDASVHNQNCSRVEDFANRQKELIKSKQELQTLGITIGAKETAREKIISTSQLPVEGLTFTDDEIYLNGLPLQDGQQNTATLIDLGADIAMALNPQLKVIFIHEGSLIDNAGLKALIKKVEAKNYQIIVERITNEDSELEVKFVETELA